MAVVAFTVSGEGKELAAVRDEVNRRASAVLAAMRGLGIAEGDINAPDVGIHPQYDYRKAPRLIGYRVARGMTVKVRDLDALGDVLDGVVAAGANEVHGARMSASDPTAADHQALAHAMVVARAKAQAIAAAAGVELGGVMRVDAADSGINGPLPRFGPMTAVPEAADAATEVAVGDLTVTRSIRAWFEIGAG